MESCYSSSTLLENQLFIFFLWLQMHSTLNCGQLPITTRLIIRHTNSPNATIHDSIVNSKLNFLQNHFHSNSHTIIMFYYVQKFRYKIYHQMLSSKINQSMFNQVIPTYFHELILCTNIFIFIIAAIHKKKKLKPTHIEHYFQSC